MSFQASDNKEKNFFELLNDESNSFEPLTIKGGFWLQYFGYLNTLYVRATKAIVNHSFLEKNSCIHVIYTLSNPNNTSCTSIKGSIITGILKKIQ